MGRSTESRDIYQGFLRRREPRPTPRPSRSETPVSVGGCPPTPSSFVVSRGLKSVYADRRPNVRPDPVHVSKSRKLGSTIVDDPLSTRVRGSTVSEGDLRCFSCFSRLYHCVDRTGRRARQSAVPVRSSFRAFSVRFGEPISHPCRRPPTTSGPTDRSVPGRVRDSDDPLTPTGRETRPGP